MVNLRYQKLTFGRKLGSLKVVELTPLLTFSFPKKSVVQIRALEWPPLTRSDDADVCPIRETCEPSWPGKC